MGSRHTHAQVNLSAPTPKLDESIFGTPRTTAQIASTFEERPVREKIASPTEQLRDVLPVLNEFALLMRHSNTGSSVEYINGEWRFSEKEIERRARLDKGEAPSIEELGWIVATVERPVIGSAEQLAIEYGEAFHDREQAVVHAHLAPTMRGETIVSEDYGFAYDGVLVCLSRDRAEVVLPRESMPDSIISMLPIHRRPAE